MANYFGFAMSSSMFSDGAICSLRKITPEEAKRLLAIWKLEGSLKSCLNPGHAATIAAMAAKYGIFVEIPEEAPKCHLETGDNLLVLQVSGLPRLGGPDNRHEYTEEEVERAQFSFDLWHCGAPGCMGYKNIHCGECPFCNVK